MAIFSFSFWGNFWTPKYVTQHCTILKSGRLFYLLGQEMLRMNKHTYAAPNKLLDVFTLFTVHFKSYLKTDFLSFTPSEADPLRQNMCKPNSSNLLGLFFTFVAEENVCSRSGLVQQHSTLLFPFKGGRPPGCH